MRILVVGAGALGGYFGGRLLAAGRDVTFLVRPRRAKQLAEAGGLRISSPVGDLLIERPPLVRADGLEGPYELVLLCCKGTALEGCLADMAPAVGGQTMILPVLNGMRHIDLLAGRFGRERVLGGRCSIFATLDGAGNVLHQSEVATLDFGELDGGESERTRAVLAALSDAGFAANLRTDIVQDMWEKWVLISTLAGATCLMRAPVGDIVRAGALPFSLALLDECAAVARANGHPPSEKSFAFVTGVVSAPESLQSASMHKDIEKGNPIESEHVVGDLVSRVPAGREPEFPLLRLVDWHLRIYEERRRRESGAK